MESQVLRYSVREFIRAAKAWCRLSSRLLTDVRSPSQTINLGSVAGVRACFAVNYCNFEPRRAALTGTAESNLSGLSRIGVRTKNGEASWLE